MKEREIGFDLLKLLAIFLVLWGHCTQYLFSSNYLDEPIYRIIYSFHMPLFIMISGYFASNSVKKNIPEFFYKKMVQLLLPCISWGTLLALVEISNGSYSFESGLHLWYLYVINYFGFLKCLFICHLLYFFSFKYCTNTIFSIIISLVLCRFIPQYYISVLFPYFLIGSMMKRYQTKVNRYKKDFKFISFILFVLLLIYFEIFGIKNVYWNDNIFSILAALLGCFSFIFLFEGIKSKNKFINKLGSYGQFTLGIYLIQVPLLEILLPRLINLDHLNFWVANVLVNPIISILVLLLCIMLIKLLCKSKLLDFMFMGNINSNNTIIKCIS